MDCQIEKGIVAVNSIFFVDSVFDCFEKGYKVTLLRSENDTERINLTGVNEVLVPDIEHGWSAPTFLPPCCSDDLIALVSFTSGTEGAPKGVILTHQALSDVTTRLNSVMELDSNIREYVGVPVNYSFGFGRCRSVAAVNGQYFLPENGFNPLEIHEMLRRDEINALSAVPSLWRIFFQNIEIFGSETEQIKWIEIGSQYMSRAEKEQLKRIFPKAIIVQHYGLTEASRTTFLRIDQTEGEPLESVGRVYGNSEVCISVKNHIKIRGVHVAKNIIKDGSIVSNLNDDNWFETNDIGEIRNSYVYFLGRSDDVINCSGIKLSPDTLEMKIQNVLKHKERIAVARIDNTVTGDGVLVARQSISNISRKTLSDVAAEVLLELGVNNRNVIRIIDVKEFPLTDTGKVKRKSLSQLYEKQKNESQNNSPIIKKVDKIKNKSPFSELELEIKAIWEDILGVEGIEVDDSFYDMGGDSLTAISAMIKLRRRGVSEHIVKGMLQGLSIRDLSAKISNDDSYKSKGHIVQNKNMKASMTINVVRGVLVLCVIFAHWSPGLFDRLPALFNEFLPYLTVISRAGTPGFAIIYGISAGYSMFPIYLTNPRRLRHILKNTFILLVSGITAIAIVNLIDMYIHCESISITDITNTFFSVLTYYALITATILFWFNVILRFEQKTSMCCLLSLVFYALFYFWIRYLTEIPAVGLVELIKLILSAKYSYFNMIAGTFGGIAAGLAIKKSVMTGQSLGKFAICGTILILGGILVATREENLSSWLTTGSGYTKLWMWLFYAGIVIIGIATVDKVLSFYDNFNKVTKWPLQALATVGILAFPLFVTHELVIPLKSILAAIPNFDAFALPISLSFFMLSTYFMFSRVHRINFC